MSHTHDHEFLTLMNALNDRFQALISNHTLVAAKVSTRGLVEVYLSTFPDRITRKEHDCSSCKAFIRKYGGVVFIAQDGTRHTIWDVSFPQIEMYNHMLSQMDAAVLRRPITHSVVGFPRIMGGSDAKFNHYTLLASSASGAADRCSNTSMQDVLSLVYTFAAFRPDTLEKAARELKNRHGLADQKRVVSALIAMNPHVPVAFTGASFSNTPLRTQDSIWWAAIKGGKGVCYAKGSIVGEFLTKVQNGTDVGRAATGMVGRKDPLKYHVATTAPKAGTIERASKLIDADEPLQKAFSRRALNLSEVQHVWSDSTYIPYVQAKIQPVKVGEMSDAAESSTGANTVRSFVKDRLSQCSSQIFRPRMTATQFLEALKVAGANGLRVGIQAKLYGANVEILQLTTCVFPDAKPILRWDEESVRNQVSWYARVGSSAGHWNISTTQAVHIAKISLMPPEWNHRDASKSPVTDRGLLLFVDGARDRSIGEGGSALFPQLLKPELREVRSVLQGMSKAAPLMKAANPAVALSLRRDSGRELNLQVRLVGRESIWTPVTVTADRG